MTPLQEKTYQLLKKVPLGRVTTYKALATALHTKGYRAIGQFMRTNPMAPTVPCHRVVSSDGSIGGFMGKTSGRMITEKISLLQKEGVSVKNGKILNFKTLLYSF